MFNITSTSGVKSGIKTSKLKIHLIYLPAMEFIVYGPDALPSLMNHVLDALNGRRKVAVYGEMGAGKTTFISALCRHLGVKDTPSSPTYSIINTYAYEGPNRQTTHFHHLDLYRLRQPQEAFDIGIQELLEDDTYCFIEWPDLIEALLPPDVARITIEVTGPTTRKVLVK
ncbi:MAG: tRNA (adenosine(37)-N6)-threonylcarbamoyltransferase complex ATPase subunit type 1 TsaE [Saprospiraceae bacterium]|nr:tRNA (adenosine(37)-N6)-threonylcarbamoyltransferase complex ATPase subunit type 1 TsaE [Saprospiraceae bacterium]